MRSSHRAHHLFGLALRAQVGIVGCAVNIIVLSCFYKETLPSSERIALSIRSSNPFSFGKLLTHGRRLRQFALMEVLNNFGSMRAVWQTTDTLRMVRGTPLAQVQPAFFSKHSMERIHSIDHVCSRPGAHSVDTRVSKGSSGKQQ